MVSEEMINKIVAEVVANYRAGNMIDTTASYGLNVLNEELEKVLSDITEKKLIDIYNVPNPANKDAFLALKRHSPTRIGIWRAGARCLTESLLRFEADHATAIDAVLNEVPREFISSLGIFEVKTNCTDKADFIKYPYKGRLLDDDGVKLVKEKCIPKPQVQVFLSDGHSAISVQANAKSILPTVIEGLKAEGISVGTPFFVRFGRVGAEDHIAGILDAEVVCDLIGERPGLGTSESMSAYIAYRPTVGMPESNRSVISNIHKDGTPVVEAGAHIVDMIKLMLEKKKSGTALSQAL
jgi:ethanolamine ammonia-lyase small subunit